MKIASASLLVSLVLILIASPLSAQKNQNVNISISDYLNLQEPVSNKSRSSKNLDLIRRKHTVSGFDPIAEIWNKTPWSDPKVNFNPSKSLVSIGDVNGDGVDDFTKRFESLADERDTDISTLTHKSLIYYGGSELSAEYDDLLYSYIYPLGDVNGDGYSDAIGVEINNQTKFLKGSPSGLTEINASISDTLLSYAQNSYRFVIGEDFNNDGREDIYGFYQNNETFSYKYFEINGTSNIDDLSVNETDFPENISIFTNYWFRFSKNDTTLVGVIERNFQTSQNAFKVFRVSENSDMILADSISIEMSGNILPLVSDFDGDGVEDFLFLTSNGNNLFYRGSYSTKPVFDSPVIVPAPNNFLHSMYETAFLRGPVILGNVMGDGRSEILTYNDHEVKIINFDPYKSNLVLTKLIHTSNFLFNSELLQRRESIYARQNSHIRGYNTFSLPIHSNDKFGNIVFKTRYGFDMFEWEIILENKADYEQKIRTELFHLDDLENDGIDNFAVVEQANNDTKIVIYNGINDQSPQSIVLENPDKMFVGHIESGFFNDNSERSLAVLLRPYSLDEDQSEFRLYNQNDLTTPVKYFRQTDLNPSLNRLDMFSNIGDINNDGFDDLAFSGGGTNLRQFVFLYLGNTTLNSTPSITLNLDEEFPNPVLGNTSMGATVVQGLGDINNDGIDDFAIGDGLRKYNIELAQSNPYISGVLYILHGQDNSTPEFNGPDFELRADITNPENRQWIFGGLNSLAVGDFDGDGIRDIVSKSLQHSDGDFTEGVGALTYFFGKNGFTSEPDTTIPIRSEYIYNESQDVDFIYSKAIGRALLQAIPDLNGDGADELLFIGNRDSRNAVLYEIGDSPTEIATALYKAPNTSLSLNPAGNYINKQYLPLVGDYNGDGKPNFLGYQQDDSNFRDTPVYMYELDNTAVSIADEPDNNPLLFSLNQNYPNPFNPSTNISFSLPQSGNVEIAIYNMIGQEISKLANSRFSAGTHSLTFDASHLASGVYLYRIKSGDFISTKKMTLIK